MSPLRLLTGGLSFLAGVVPQVAKHESCVWIGAEILAAFGLGLLAFELGLHVRLPLTGTDPKRTV